MVIENLLKPGDCLLYSRNSAINKLIAFKTFSPFTHVEVWLGDRASAEIQNRLGIALGRAPVFASRNPQRVTFTLKAIGGGVNLYAPNFDGLALIRRPKQFDIEKAIDWLSTPGILGQPYDVIGLFNFYIAKWRGKENGAMFCSEAATRFYKVAGTIVGENIDADTVSPGMLAAFDSFTNVVKL